VRALNGTALRALRGEVGFVFQRHNLVGRLPARSNVLHGPKGRRCPHHPGLGPASGRLGVAVGQPVVADLGLGTLAVALQPAAGDGGLAQHAAALHHSPPRRLQCRVDMFGAGLGFVHASLSP